MRAWTALLAVVTLTAFAGGGLAAQATHTCQVLVGAPGASVEAGPATIGGCTLVEQTSQDRTVVSLAPGDDPVTPGQDCTIHADDDNDGIAERQLSTGDTVLDGASLLAFCEAGLVLDNSITLA